MAFSSSLEVFRFNLGRKDTNDLSCPEEERQMPGLCQGEEIGVIPWSPLARGKLARPWEDKPSTTRAGTDEYAKKLHAHTEAADRAAVNRMTQIAARRGLPRAQIALAWMLHKPVVTAPIIGATKPGHL
jgi:1-deoxyxylulose-5-phosphate synthase